jgi:hypothetical protein
MRRACALLGSLECVHGAVDKGISLLEQAADKVFSFVCFENLNDLVVVKGCL